MKKVNSWSKLIAYVYLYIPLIVFFLTWTKVWVALPCLLGIGIIIFYILKEQKDNNTLNAYHEKKIIIIVAATMTLLIIGAWCILSGVGGYVYQGGDWAKHNLLLKELCSSNWPVRVNYDGKEGLLSYYLGYYLLPATIGKLFGFDVASFILMLWTVVGAYIVCHNFTITFANKYRYIILACFVFITFSTLVIPLSSLYRIWLPDDLGYNVSHWLSLSTKIQYTPNIVSMRWVTPQFIPTAVVVTLLFREKEYKRWGCAVMPLILYSTFSFVGVVAIMLLYIAMDLIVDKKKLNNSFKELFSISNIISVLVALPLVLYTLGTVFQSKPDEAGMNFELINYSNNLLLLIIFQLSWMIWMFITWKSGKANIWFLSSGILLFFLPFFSYGKWNDLCMRTSIPALCIFTGIVFKTIMDNIKQNKAIVVAICFLLTFCAIGNSKEILDAVELSGIHVGNYYEGYASIEEAIVETDLYEWQYVNWEESGILKAIIREE